MQLQNDILAIQFKGSLSKLALIERTCNGLIVGVKLPSEEQELMFVDLNGKCERICWTDWLVNIRGVGFIRMSNETYTKLKLIRD